jgi:hypothetical protein
MLYPARGASEADADSDEYHDPYSSSDHSNDGSDDEYMEGPSASSSRRRPRGRRGKSASSRSSPPSTPKKLTARQTRTCLQAFALFFPTVSASELPNQKIMIKDIQRVAKVLGENIKANEVSPDY